MLNWADNLTSARIRALESMLPSFVEIGARYIILPVLADDGPLIAIAESLCRVCEILAPFGLTAGLEPIGHVPRLSRIEDALDVLARVPEGLAAGLALMRS